MLKKNKRISDDTFHQKKLSLQQITFRSTFHPIENPIRRDTIISL